MRWLVEGCKIACQLWCTLGQENRAREERAHGSTEQDDIISRVYRPGEGCFISVQSAEDLLKEGWRVCAQGGCLAVAVEFEKLRKEREDEGEGDLAKLATVSQRCPREAWTNQVEE